MTSSDLAPSSLRETGSRTVEGASVAACGFCRRRLSNEFFFTCRLCDASYCYIHMSRHQPTTCARRASENTRDRALGGGATRPPASVRDGPIPLIGAGPRPRGGSSANV
jgi:hypothetical protein